jgi:predicted acyltransferase
VPAELTQPAVSVQSPPSKPSRITAIDALRGFDMIWIIGGADVLRSLAIVTKQQWLVPQFEHIDWAGLHFYDVIFPLFIFIVGVSLVFSLTKSLERVGHAATIKHILRRTAVLYLLGFLFSGGLMSRWPDLHFVGVLQRIAAGYFFASLAFCFLKTRGLMICFIILLIGYDAMMTFIPIRDIRLDKKVFDQITAQTDEKDPARIFLNTTNWTNGKFERGYNLANQIDFEYLPGFKGYGYYDPDGLLSTIPVIATCLLGLFAGLLLSGGATDKTKIVTLLLGGSTAVAVGFIWSLHFPIVKRLWSPSFVMITGGISAIALAAFYWIIDIAKFERWTQPFIWVGMNSITIYFSKCLVDYTGLANRFVGGDIKKFFNREINGAGDLLVACVGLAIALWLCRFLCRRQIFLKV